MTDCGDLKKKRSYAQGTFNRRVNSIDFNMELLTEHDLISEMRALKTSYEDICNSSLTTLLLWRKRVQVILQQMWLR